MSIGPRSPRRARGVLAVASVAVVALVATGRSAALENDAVTLPARKVVEVDMPVIPAPEPASVTVGGVVGPDECRALPSCALTPLDVEIPELDPGDDFYVILTMSFPQPSGGEDLDTYLYDDGQMAEAEGSSGYTLIGSSASGDNPEIIKAFEPLLGRYNLVVQNFTGVGVPWHLKAESIVGDFTAPNELLAPEPGQGTVNPNNKPTTTTTAAATTEATTTTVSIPEAVVLPDDDFEGGEFDFDELVAEVDAAQALAAELEANREPKSPSVLSILLWMVALPVALVAGAAVFLTRSRRGRRLRRAATAG